MSSNSQVVSWYAILILYKKNLFTKYVSSFENAEYVNTREKFPPTILYLSCTFEGASLKKIIVELSVIANALVEATMMSFRAR